MYLNKDQIDKRLKSATVIKPIGRVNTQGNRERSHEEKVLIGVLSKFDTQRNVAAAFGTSHQNVSLISRGLENGNRLDTELRDDIKKATPKTEEISNKALDVLMNAIGVVGETIGSTKKATDASVVARNVASVFNSLRPSGSSPSGGARVQININAPGQKAESAFESIEV